MAHGSSREITLRTRRRVRAAAGAIVLFVLASTSTLAAQDAVDSENLLRTFDDPTLMAREIDARVSTVVADCMETENQPYEVSVDARFRLEDISIEDTLKRGIEPSFGELVPQLVDPDTLPLDTVTFDPDLFNPDVLIDRDLLEPFVVPDVLVEDALVDVRRTDLGVRLDPEIQGYGIALQGYELLEPDPNLIIVESLPRAQLIDYEVALYGVELVDLGDDETGGCAEEGVDVLLAEIIPELEERDAELGRLQAAIATDPGHVEALEAWRSCMIESGVDDADEFFTPDDAIDWSRNRFELAGRDDTMLRDARMAEMKLAAVDFGCRAGSTDLATASVVAREGALYADGVDVFVGQLELIRRAG